MGTNFEGVLPLAAAAAAAVPVVGSRALDWRGCVTVPLMVLA